MTTRLKRKKISSSRLPLSTSSIDTNINTKSAILSDDIMIKIFNTLPHKTLIKLCIICKSWLDMIANPHRSDSVYSLRLKSNPPHLSILAFFHQNSKFRWKPIILSGIGNDPLSLQNPDLSKLYDDKTIKVDASFNDYILCHRRYYDPVDSIYHWYYYVISPFSQQWLHLPRITLQGYNNLDDCLVGFGSEVDFTSPLVAAHFIVVLATERTLRFQRSVLELRVFYSNHRSYEWRKFSIYLQDRPGMCLMYSERRGVFIDGVFYWIRKDVLEAVDLRKGKVKKVIKIPYNDYTSYLVRNIDMTNYAMLGVFENKLFYGYQDYNDKIIRVFVYEGELDGDRGFWVLKYTMLPEVLMSCSSIKGVVKDEGSMVILRGFHPKNPAIFFFIKSHGFISYDAQTQCLVDHCYMWRERSVVLCEWSGWPHSLPLVKYQGSRN